MSIIIEGSDGYTCRKVRVHGIGVLVKPMENESKTSGGIIIPEGDRKEDKPLSRGLVVAIGPGFLVPDKTDSIESILEPSISAKYVSLDITIGEIAYYDKGHVRELRIDGVLYNIVPYPAICISLKDEIKG